MFVFCKQKTAYEMRISDWSSDVCSSDLTANGLFTGVVTGFRNGEDLGSATDGTLTFTSIADQFSPVGNYAIAGGGLTATNYVFVQDPGNATRSEERRVGKECVSTRSSRRSQKHQKKKELKTKTAP